MALESRIKLTQDNFSPESDLIEVYSKKAGLIGVIHPNQISSPSPSGSLKTDLPLFTTLQAVKDYLNTASPLLLSTLFVTNRGGGNITTNTVFGQDVMESNTTGNKNTVFGNAALFNNQTGSNNSAFGNSALGANSTGSNNTAIGRLALGFDSNGDHNTAIGDQANVFNTTGSYNTSVGGQALFNNFTGNNNVALGWSALRANTASNNTAVGYQAGLANTSGTNNTLLGHGTVTGNFSGSVILGKDATATANNQFVVGSSAVNAGSVVSQVNSSTKYWEVVINGVTQKVLLA